MSEKGILEVSGRKIKLLNKETLHNILSGEKMGI